MTDVLRDIEIEDTAYRSDPGRVHISSPRHLGLIPDGTRRWSRKTGIELGQAYCRTATLLVSHLEDLFRTYSGIDTISLFMVRPENLERPAGEMAAALESVDLFVNSIVPVLDSLAIGFRVVGTENLTRQSMTHAYGAAIRAAVARLKTVERTFRSSRTGRGINALVGYHYTEELSEALSHTTTASDLQKRLWISDPVNLVIRTGGVARLSGFLPLQSANADLLVLQALFPDTTSKMLLDAVEAYRTNPHPQTNLGPL